MIIGVCGFKGSGKDTVANIISETYGLEKASLAAHLKDVVSLMFGLDRRMLEGDTDESREWREQILGHWSELLGYTVTPRYLLQRIGAMIKRCIHKDFFILKLGETSDIVIADLRHLNEVPICDIIIRVERFDYSVTTIDQMDMSEKQHLEFTPTFVIENRGTMEELRDKVLALDLKLTPLPQWKRILRSISKYIRATFRR